VDNPALIALSTVISYLYLLVFALYVPILAISYPFFTEENMGGWAAFKRAARYFRHNFFNIALAVVTTYLILGALYLALTAATELIKFIFDEYLVLGETLESSAFNIFMANTVKVLILSFVMLITLMMPLVGYSYYILLKGTEEKKDIDTAYSDLKSRYATSRKAIEEVVIR
jgi:hypothetical protein